MKPCYIVELTKWEIYEEAVDVAINDIMNNIEYNNSIDPYLNKELCEFIDIILEDKLSNKSKTAIQQYYLNHFNMVENHCWMKEYFGERFEFVNEVLGLSLVYME